jgi:uncharacterized coiled-coil protein SlyX
MAHAPENSNLFSSSPSPPSSKPSSNVLGRKENRPYARRLQLRNAGFRAPLLPGRKTSPMTGNNTYEPLVQSNDENTGTFDKLASKRDLSGSSNILQEISNSSRRRKVSRTPFTEIFESSIDNQDRITSKENASWLRNGTINRSDMPSTSPYGSLNSSSKNRKKSRTSTRAPSFQAAKYIEYLESELTASNAKLDSLKSPETVRGQAAAIRKLDKQIQVLTRDLTEWEQTFEERVNDEVFNRTQGDGNLRLRIQELEENVVRKDIHIIELGKELEETRVKLSESRSAEATLCHRLDVLTDVLAKSPVKNSFPPLASSSVELSNSTLTSKPFLSRVPTSPVPSISRSGSIDEQTRRHSFLVSPRSVPEAFEYSVDCTLENAIVDDQEFYCPSNSTRPTSGTFTSASGQSFSSRPTSIMSTGSTGVSWGLPVTNEERPAVGKHKKSRRFAPGNTGLKPLILPATTMLPASLPTSVVTGSNYETPLRSNNEDYREPSVMNSQIPEISMSSPSRPGHRRPISWTHSSSKQTSQEVNADDSFVEFTKDLLLSSTPNRVTKSFHQQPDMPFEILDDDLIPQSSRSLEQELWNDEDSDQEDHTESVLMTSEQMPVSQGSIDDAKALRIHSSLGSKFDESMSSILTEGTVRLTRPVLSRQSFREPESLCFVDHLSTPLSRIPYLTNLLSSLGHTPFTLARRLIFNSWVNGVKTISRFARWLLNIVSSSRRCGNSTSNQELLRLQQPNRGRLGTPFSPINSEPRPLTPQKGPVMPLRGTLQLESRSPGLLEYVPRRCCTSHAQSISLPHGHPTLDESISACPNCVEPAGKRKVKLWAKFTLALFLAVSVACMEGPEKLIGDLSLDAPMAHDDRFLEDESAFDMKQPSAT